MEPKEEDMVNFKEAFMKMISILLLLALTSCNALVKDKEEIKKIGHDIVDEGVEDATKEMKKNEKEVSARKSS
jgi:hypothetical protein